jgi:heme ABC exporter ATP-binding subunit CcmA
MANNSTPEESLAVDIAGVSRSFGSTMALRQVDLSLGWGQTLVLFGHNGAGKSTLLRTLSSLIRPDEGSVCIAGFDRDKQGSRVRESVGYVGHQPLLYDELSPIENLRFYARLYRVRNAPQRIRNVLIDVGAAEWAERRVRTLSNGMQKRVAIARALLHKPAVLLLDEPETGLDQSGLKLLEDVVTAVRGGGASVVITTHNIERGLALADRVAVLTRGRIVFDGASTETSAADLQGAIGLQPEVA